MTAFPKPTRWRSPKYRDAAKGQNCTLRLPGCQNDTETVVLCHNNGAGMALKTSDHDAVDACAHCHSLLDGVWKFFPATKEDIFDQARIETMVNRIERGVLK